SRQRSPATATYARCLIRRRRPAISRRRTPSCGAATRTACRRKASRSTGDDCGMNNTPPSGRQREIDTAAAFEQAMALHRSGRVTEAEALYRSIIAVAPRHFDSLHLLGVIAHQRGDHAEAVRQIDVALAVNPASLAAHSNRGSALKALKRYDDALASYDSALAVKANHPELLFNRATVLQELVRLDEALADFDRALLARPDYVDALINRGTVLHEL